MIDASYPTDPYAQIVELYDLEHDDFDDDIDFYLNSIAAVGDPVLELGCGTGRLVRPIAAAGFRVTGIDQSEPMLSRARSLLPPALRTRVTLVNETMTSCASAPGGPFGTVIVGLNGLLHFTDPADQRSALASAKAALDPRGQLLIDVLNPTLESLTALDRNVVHEGTWTLADSSVVDKFSARSVSSADQLIHARIWYDILATDRTVTRMTTEFDQRYVFRHELELMLELAGFAEWQVYGSYDLDPFDEHAGRLIVAAEVTPSR